jgi:hypothetical protein
MPPIYLEGGEDAAAYLSETKKRKTEDPLLDDVRREVKSAKAQQAKQPPQDTIGKLMFVVAGAKRVHQKSRYFRYLEMVGC